MRYFDPRIEEMPPEDIKKLQYRLLKTLVYRLYSFSPFYHDRMRETGVHPDDIRGLEDIRKLPFMYKSDLRDRRWAYPPEYAEMMRDAYLLRYALIPYIYTAARQTYETGVAFLRPLYYDYPDRDEAYTATHEYLFGDSLLVSPITSSADESGMASQSVWLPPGYWVEWFTGTTLQGPATIDRQFGLDEIPVYVKAGAIVPMQPKMRYTDEKPVDPLIVTVFPGADAGATRVYEDEGVGLGYKKDEDRHTKLSAILQRDVVSSKDLTMDEASDVIDTLGKELSHGTE